MINALLFPWIALWTGTADLFPQNPACTTVSVDAGAAHAFRVQSKRCAVLVSGNDNGPRARSYIFSENGTFLIFNVFGESGSLSRDTGARTYFLFPRTGLPNVEVDAKDGLRVTTAGAESVLFSAKTASLQNFSGFSFHEESEITDDNQGGVELKPLDSDKFLLDTGWAVGHVAFADRYGTSTFIFADAVRCEVPNKEIFSYDPDPSDPELRFKTDSELRDYVQQKCRKQATSSERLYRKAMRDNN